MPLNEKKVTKDTDIIIAQIEKLMHEHGLSFKDAKAVVMLSVNIPDDTNIIGEVIESDKNNSII